MEKEKFYITTAIAYTSKKPHIGNTYEIILTDAIARFNRFIGKDVFFLTGTDEHGQKIQEIAEAEGITPKEHVDKIAGQIRDIADMLNVSYDKFIRTTDDYHCKAVKKIVQTFLNNGDIYKGKYEDWYCIPCENYFTETQLVDGKCPDCGREVKKMSEDAYFFNMKKYENWLKEFYANNPDFIVPESRKNEIFNNFINPGLEDLCISRNTFDWGIPLPNDPEHVLYVWLDALTNYITALGYMSDDETLFNKYWPADLQIMAKEIIRFHGIYWPIFLHALGLELPKKLYAHSWIVMKDGKMSKSVGNIIYPETLIERYGLDATKYYLLKLMSFAQDSMFTPEDFVEKFNADLANDLGNLLNRTIGMCNKYFDGVVSASPKVKTDFDDTLEQFTNEQISKVEELMDSYHISQALSEIWAIIARANKYIDETTPWVLAKSENEEDKERLKSVMLHLVETLRKIAVMLIPFMPNTSEEIFKQLGIESQELKTWDSLSDNENIKDTKVIEKGEPLFMRLDAEEEVEYLQSIMKK